MGNICASPCLEVVESRDFEVLERLIFDEDIVKALLTENYSYQQEKLNNNNAIYYLFKIDKEPVGFCALLNISKNEDKIYIVDIGFIKEFRGKFAYKLARMAKDKFFNDFKPDKLYAKVKIENKKSIFFSMKTGFVIFNRDNEHCYLESVCQV